MQDSPSDPVRDRRPIAAFPPDAKFPRACSIAVRIGAPLQFADASNDRTGWHAIAARAETAVRGLASP